ncbi:hypothetical protein [Actinophytocola glycyrrhizae]|uniref:DUF5666 domain-containing protein n=1 Tax=Actinophytocola glycyrrhizae TaxID=2044873 RepID=A0ABV9RU04_9PSEU
MSECTAGRLGRWAVVGVAVLLPFSVAACGEDVGQDVDQDEGIVNEEVPDGDLYFEDGREFVGDLVSISGEATDVLSPTSFEVDGQEWGDETVLVLAGEQTGDVHEGDVVDVTGVLRVFGYERYTNEYGLTGPTRYEPYEGEKFIEATEIGRAGAASSGR